MNLTRTVTEELAVLASLCSLATAIQDATLTEATNVSYQMQSMGLSERMNATWGE